MISIISIIDSLSEEISHIPIIVIRNKTIQFITDKWGLVCYENSYSGFVLLDESERYATDITDGVYATEEVVFQLQITNWMDF